MSTKQIVAEALTTFDVDDEGMFVTLHVRDETGQPASLVLPAHCLNQLLMSMPKMIQTAIQNRYDDAALRLVYPLRHFTFEAGTQDAAGVQQFILSLSTDEGFSVSFSAPESKLASLVTAVVDDVQQYEPPPTAQLRYS